MNLGKVSLTTLAILGILLGASLQGSETAPEASKRAIKGLQVQMLDDAISLGIHHATLNVNLSHLEGLSFPQPSESALAYARSLKQQIQRLTQAKIKVYLILLVYPEAGTSAQPKILEPKHDPSMQFTVGAMHASTSEGRDLLRQVVREFLVQLGTEELLPIEGFIVGNEVNSSKIWNNHGPLPLEKAVEYYVKNVGDIYHATREHQPNSKIYLSLDHFWAQDMHEGRLPTEFYPGRKFLDSFQKLMASTEAVPWHVAYHPYPENLFKPKTWEDRSALPHADTPRITFKNLEVLCEYLKRDEMLLDGKPRSLILSEQGLHSAHDAAGHALQAMAFTYVWDKIESLPEIDAFIWHRHVDHRDEGGLNLGLWTRREASVVDPQHPKPIYELFRAAGTDTWQQVSEPFRTKLKVQEPASHP